MTVTLILILLSMSSAIITYDFWVVISNLVKAFKEKKDAKGKSNNTNG